MDVKRQNDATLEQLLDPQSPAWQSVKATSIALEGTPSMAQPTEAIRETWANKKIGSIGKVNVQAIHNGKELAFRLEWSSPQANTSHGNNAVFPDGAAIAFPAVENAPVMMGAPEMPITIWFWRASDEASGQGDARQIDAQGIGTSDTVDKNQVKTRSLWKDGKWSVVIARSMQVIANRPVAQLKPGEKANYAIAIWDGSHGERGGIKSYSGMMWLELNLSA